MEGFRVAYILVTYNRLNMLKQTITAINAMSEKPDYLYIVDNCSTDGTKEYLDNLNLVCVGGGKKIDVKTFHMNSNIGGSGAFSFGTEMASKELDCDFIFLADDDAVPDVDMLKTLRRKYEILQNKSEIVALCTSVMNDKEIDLFHRCLLNKKSFKAVPIKKEKYTNDFFVDLASFVGLLIKASVIKEVGYPRGDFFIFYDDTEYSIRLSKFGKILCIPDSKMYHNINKLIKKQEDWRTYYRIRNRLIVVKLYSNKFTYLKKKISLYIKRQSLLAILLHKSTKIERIIIKQAIKDANKNRLGISEKYRP